MAGRRQGLMVGRRLDRLGLAEIGRACDRFLRERGVPVRGLREVIAAAAQREVGKRRRPKVDAVERAARELERAARELERAARELGGS